METETFKIFGLIYSYSVPFSFFFLLQILKILVKIHVPGFNFPISLAFTKDFPFTENSSWQV